MDIRQLTPTYHVAPQLEPSDFAGLAAQGFTTVICNRPDNEVPPSHHAASMAQAAAENGLTFHALPITMPALTPDVAAAQRGFLNQAESKVVAYCASGTRSAIAWALSEAEQSDVEKILETARNAGYALDALRPTLEAIAAQAR